MGDYSHRKTSDITYETVSISTFCLIGVYCRVCQSLGPDTPKFHSINVTSNTFVIPAHESSGHTSTPDSKPAWRSLFFPQLDNHEDNQDSHQDGEHWPNPHPAVHPPMHLAVVHYVVIHHDTPFVMPGIPVSDQSRP